MKHANHSDKPEQHEIVLLARQGDEDAFERLLADYAPLISSLVKNTVTEFSFADSDYEDLYQEAVIFFLRAINRYDTEQDGVAFGLFAKICIRNGLLSQAKKMQRRANILSCVEGEGPSKPIGCEAGPDALLIEEEHYRTLHERVRKTLSPYENRVWWRYLSGRTARDIAEELETDEKSVQNAIFRIRRKLRAVIPHP